MIDHPLVLIGKGVRLEPLTETHIPALLEIARAAPDAYRHTSTPITDAQAETYFGAAFRGRDAGHTYPFALIHHDTGEAIGTSRYADIRWQHRNLELGYTWIDTRYQGTPVNAESKYLMLRHVFEVLNFVRVQLHTDTRNQQSQAAIRKLGAVYEGVLRKHMIVKEGYVRDTMVFSIVDNDWPGVKRGLEARLAQGA